MVSLLRRSAATLAAASTIALSLSTSAFAAQKKATVNASAFTGVFAVQGTSSTNTTRVRQSGGLFQDANVGQFAATGASQDIDASAGNVVVISQ